MFAPSLNQVHWQRASIMKRKYQLVNGYFCVGELVFDGSMSYSATGSFEGKTYHFRKSSIFTRDLIATDLDTDQVVATATSTWGTRGKVELHNSDMKLKWKMNAMGNKVMVSTHKNEVLAEFNLGYKMEKTVSINFLTDIFSDEEMGFLSLLGMYFLAVYTGR